MGSRKAIARGELFNCHRKTQFTMSNPEFRHTSFNINTNGVLDKINGYLVSEANSSPPKYTKIAKHMETTALSKLHVALHVVDTKDYREDHDLDSIRYKLYLCEGLISYLEGKNPEAKQFFQKACEYPDHSMVEYYRDIVRSTGVRLSKRHKYTRASTNDQLDQGLAKGVFRALGEGLITFFVLDYLLFAPPYVESLCVKEQGSDKCMPWAHLLSNQAQGKLFIVIILLSLLPIFILLFGYMRRRKSNSNL